MQSLDGGDQSWYIGKASSKKDLEQIGGVAICRIEQGALSRVVHDLHHRYNWNDITRLPAKHVTYWCIQHFEQLIATERGLPP